MLDQNPCPLAHIKIHDKMKSKLLAWKLWSCFVSLVCFPEAILNLCVDSIYTSPPFTYLRWPSQAHFLKSGGFLTESHQNIGKNSLESQAMTILKSFKSSLQANVIVYNTIISAHEKGAP